MRKKEAERKRRIEMERREKLKGNFLSFDWIPFKNYIFLLNLIFWKFNIII